MGQTTFPSTGEFTRFLPKQYFVIFKYISCDKVSACPRSPNPGSVHILDEDVFIFKKSIHFFYNHFEYQVFTPTLLFHL